MQLLDILSFLGILRKIATRSNDILLEKVLHKLILHLKIWIHSMIIALILVVERKCDFTRLLPSFLNTIRDVIIVHRYQIGGIYELIQLLDGSMRK